MARSHSLFPKLPSLDVCVAKAHSRSMMAIFLFCLFSPFLDLEENFFRCASAQIYTQKIFLFPSSLSSPMSPRLFCESCRVSFTIPIHRHSTWFRCALLQLSTSIQANGPRLNLRGLWILKKTSRLTRLFAIESFVLSSDENWFRLLSSESSSFPEKDERAFSEFESFL